MQPSASSPQSFVTAREFDRSSSEDIEFRSDDFPQELMPKEAARISHLPSGATFLRPAKELPYELKNHTYVFFSEEAYLEAVSLLQRLLEQGHGVSTPEKPLPAYIPPPQQLALLATLIVYPKATTHSTSVDSRKASQDAFRYLRTLSAVVGPVNADLKTCFAFQDGPNNRKVGRSAESDSSGEDEDYTHITRPIANKRSVWTQAKSFWHIVGWTFNCSRKCRFRFAPWRYLLEVMLEIIEADWTTRMQLVTNRNLTGQDQLEAYEDAVQQSMLWSYIVSENAWSSTGRRKLLRAIFATGTKEDLNLFDEVYEGESKKPEPPDEEKKKHLREVNLDEDDFGDYGSDEDEDESMEDVSARRSSRQNRKATDNSASNEGSDVEKEEFGSEGVDYFGGVDALHLRQRIITLLAKLASTAPRIFTTEADLFDNVTEFVRPLPTSVFSLFLTTLNLERLDRNVFNSLLLFDIITKQRPPKQMNAIDPPIADIIRYILPIASKTSSTSEHAKVSIIVEQFVQATMRSMSALEGDRKAQFKKAIESGAFRGAMEEGIDSRRSRAIGDARKRGKGFEGEEKTARMLFDESCTRLRMHLDLCEKLFNTRKPKSKLDVTSSQMSSSSLSSVPSDGTESDTSDAESDSDSHSDSGVNPLERPIMIDSD